MSHQGDDPNAPRERQQGPEQSRQPQQQPPQQSGQPQGGRQRTQQPPQQSGQPPTTQRQSGQQQPIGGGQQPPMSGGQQPRGGPSQQMGSGQQPMGGGQQQPMTGGQQPMGRPSQQMGGGQQPMGGGQQQPMTGGQQPMGRPSQQMGGGQPSGVQGGASIGIQGPQQTIQPRGETRRGGALQPMTVNEIMRSDVVTCETDTPITTVVSKMAEEDVGMVVVVDGQSPIDVITDRAIALALEDNPEIADGTAEDLMTEGDLVTGSSDMTIVEALEKMSSENIRRLPIVDDDGNLEGVISLDDVLIVFGKGLSDVADLITNQVMR